MITNPIRFKMTTTALVTTATIIALGIYDLACVTFGNDSISVSAFLINAGVRAPMTVFAIGYVCGHLFGYMKPITDCAAPEQKASPMKPPPYKDPPHGSGWLQ